MIVFPVRFSRRSGGCLCWAAAGGRGSIYESAATAMANVKDRLGILILFLPTLSACETNARTGVSRTDITPQLGHAMGDYANRTADATGTHDPLPVLVVEYS